MSHIKAHLTASAAPHQGQQIGIGPHRTLCGMKVIGPTGAAWHDDVCPTCLGLRKAVERRPLYVIMVMP